MKNIFSKSSLLVLAMLSLFGCAGLPTREEVATADFGSYPSNYEEIVKSYYSRVLKDPDAAKYQNITLPEKFWYGNRFEGAKYGYKVCARSLSDLTRFS
jgi:hypothetical protein